MRTSFAGINPLKSGEQHLSEPTNVYDGPQTLKPTQHNSLLFNFQNLSMIVLGGGGRMQPMNNKTLMLEGSDLQEIQDYLKTSNFDYFQALSTLAHVTYGGSVQEFVNIETDEVTKGQYSDLIERLEDALRRHNS